MVDKVKSAVYVALAPPVDIGSMLDAVTTPATLSTLDTPGSSVPTFQVKTPSSISESPKTSMFISEGNSLVTTTSFRGTLQVFST